MDVFIGQISIFPFTYTPQGWAPCNGQILPIIEYQALFSLIGNRFGGDNVTTFALPNYTNQAPSGSQYYIALNGLYPPRA
jgi:microcystin-dependent protein